MRTLRSRRSGLTRLLVAICAVPLAACSASTAGNGEGPGSGHRKAPTLHERWKQTVGGEPGSEQQLVGGSAEAKRVYVSDVSGHVYALDAKTGALTWTRRPGARAGVGVGLAGNRALFFDTDLGIFALDTATGAQVWARAAVNLARGQAFRPATGRGIWRWRQPTASLAYGWTTAGKSGRSRRTRRGSCS